MDLEFTDEQLELRETARSVLAGACPPSLVRSVYDGIAGADVLWKTLCDLDWPALGLPEQHGGLGLGPVEVGIVVEELARVSAPSPYLATVTNFVPMVRAAGSSFRLDEVASGSCTATLAVAESGRWDPAATGVSAERVGGGWRLQGVTSHVLDGASADELAVVVRSEDGLG
ncbi:MAG: acyl-CoA/acyl-ACP dehydrogenase, partial [Acidobacteria bacterium]|nr:acyl-CoA/acyl-ACP dehydrogenase [Acidobacteriota bacterium]